MSVKIDGDIGVIPVGNASGVAFTPVGGIAANNVQDALQEVDAEKLTQAQADARYVNVDGDTMTGDLQINTGIIVGGADALGVILPSNKNNLTSDASKCFVGALDSGAGHIAGSLLLQPRGGVNAGIVFATEGAARSKLLYNGSHIFGNFGEPLSGVTNYNAPINAIGGPGLEVSTNNAINAGMAAAFSRTTDGQAIRFQRGTTTVGNVSVSASATAYNTTSDYRLKDNPQPLTGSGAFIDSLMPKTWNWKETGEKGVGFIAHEVQAVSPSSVSGEKDGEDMQTMEYGSAEFIANIVAELQSLRRRVAELESKQ